MNEPQKDLIRFLLYCIVAIGIFCIVLAKCHGQDLSGGYSFVPNDLVTPAKLNSLVGSGSINVQFLTAKSTAHPIEADSFLFYQASSGLFRKDSFADGLLGNTNLIMLRNEKTSLATNDFKLIYSTADGVLMRVAVVNAFPLGGFVELTNAPQQQYMLYITSNGNPYRVSMTNLLQNWFQFTQLANPSNAISDPTNYYLSSRGVPVKTDALEIWAGNTNKYITLSNLVNLSATATIATNGDYLWGYSTNDVQTEKFLVSQIQGYVTNKANSPTLAYHQTWTTNNVVLGNGVLVNAAHGLGGIPQAVRWVLIQTNTATDSGWGVGREVAIEAFFDSSTGKPWFAVETDSTGTILVAANTGTMQTRWASSGLATNAVPGNWNAKAYLTFFP